MNILITGNAGLIGSNLSRWIRNNVPEAYVYGCDDFSGGYNDNVGNIEKQYYCDVCSDNLEQIFKDQPIDYVFHCAAYAAEGLSPFIRKFNYHNNLIGTTNVINNCIKFEVRKMIFFSSIAVYGHGVNDVFDENDICLPNDPYGVAKLASEQDLKIAGEQHGLDWTIIRAHNVYGPNQNIWDKYRNVIGIFMFQKLNNLPLTVFGDGEQTRQFSYIEDILEPLWNTIRFPSTSKQVINLGGIDAYSINEVLTIIQDVFGKSEVQYLEKRHEVTHASTTYKKSMDLLQFRSKTNLKTGISKMWEWAQRQPNRPQYIWPKYEIDKGMYKSWQIVK